MTTFTVWAPKAKQVEVVVGDDRHPMHTTERGWWETEVEAGAGTDYGFSLDGGPGVSRSAVAVPAGGAAWPVAG